jgi:hypothetical protein
MTVQGGTRGSTSDAAADHLAFNYFGALSRLAILMSICEKSSDGNGLKKQNCSVSRHMIRGTPRCK